MEGYDSPSIRIRFRASPGVPRIQGHHDVLGQALRNLVVNAMEALAEGSGSQIEVAVTSSKNEVQPLVRDDGPGLPAELIDDIWLPDVTTRRRGSGLGLAMVRRAAEIHGGTAIARNRLEGGAEVELRLPLGREEVTTWTS